MGDDVFDQWEEARVRSIYHSLIMKHELVNQRAVYYKVSARGINHMLTIGKVSSDFV